MKKLILSYFLITFWLFASSQSIASATLDILTGRFDPKEHPAFVKIPDRFTDNSEMYVQSEVLNAFKRMYADARKDGIKLFIVSATRTFYRQAEIWNYKWDKGTGIRAYRAATILQYSSMPGTSRHHWGTDIDLCSTENEDWDTPELQKALAWLQLHAAEYGFFMPYTDDPNRPGYKYEPWHWSYFPISDIYTETYRNTITNHDLYGFRGYTAARQLNVISNYVLGIASH